MKIFLFFFTFPQAKPHYRLFFKPLQIIDILHQKNRPFRTDSNTRHLDTFLSDTFSTYASHCCSTMPVPSSLQSRCLFVVPWLPACRIHSPRGWNMATILLVYG